MAVKNRGRLSSFSWGKNVSPSPLQEVNIGPVTTKASFSSIRWQPLNVSPANWFHHLFYSDPGKAKNCDLAYLYIGGGTLSDSKQHDLERVVSQMSQKTNCWSAAMNQVPNQDLRFFNEPTPIREDTLIARSFAQYFKTRDPTWIINFAMVKSVVLAMDQLEALHERRTGKKLRGFIISGKSKRGWVAWLTAAIDPRVKGVIPIAIDILGMKKMLQDQLARYGVWSPSLRAYVQLGILARLETPEFQKLVDMVDPFSYRQHLTAPKLIISAANDPFFVPDAAKFSFESLPGPKFLITVPNVGHYIEARSDYYTPTVQHFVRTLGQNKPLPAFEIYHLQDSLQIRSLTPVSGVVLHQAYSPTGPDFRDTSHRQFHPFPAGHVGEKVKLPPRNTPGWYAWFADVTLMDEANQPLRLSSRVFVDRVQ